MDIEYLPEAEKNLDKLSDDIEDKIRSKISELEKQSTSHSKVCLVKIKGQMLFRMKINEGQLDYRAVFDIIDGKIYIANVFNRKEYEYHELDPDLALT